MSERSHEADGANVRGALLAAAGLVAALLVVLGALRLWTGTRPDAGEPAAPEPAPSSPGPLDDLPAIRAELYGGQRRRLSAYGWVDEARGIAHVPIEEAMRRIAERGWPSFDVEDREESP